MAIQYTAVDANNTPQQLTLTLNVDDEEPDTRTLNLVGDGTVYICKGSGYDLFKIKYNSMPTYSSEWLRFSNYYDYIKVTLEASNNYSHIKPDTTFDIVFK